MVKNIAFVDKTQNPEVWCTAYESRTRPSSVKERRLNRLTNAAKPFWVRKGTSIFLISQIKNTPYCIIPRKIVTLHSNLIHRKKF